jgi:hypothetical protein
MAGVMVEPHSEVTPSTAPESLRSYMIASGPTARWGLTKWRLFMFCTHRNLAWGPMMYVVFSGDLEEQIDPALQCASTLEQAFARIACLCGYSYAFEQTQFGWQLVFVDVERPELSPDTIISTMVKIADAKRELMTHAVDGRLKGFVAILQRDFERSRSRAQSSAVD